jgi:hypothetical protein
LTMPISEWLFISLTMPLFSTAGNFVCQVPEPMSKKASMMSLWLDQLKSRRIRRLEIPLRPIQRMVPRYLKSSFPKS